MTYKVTYQQRQGYLHATITGENSVDAVAGYLNDILEECKQRECYCALIDEQLEGPRLGVDAVFSLASEGAMNAIGIFHAIAFVDEKMGHMAEFAENIAVNRGMPVRAFPTIGHAEEWLKTLVEGPEEQGIFDL